MKLLSPIQDIKVDKDNKGDSSKKDAEKDAQKQTDKDKNDDDEKDPNIGIFSEKTIFYSGSLFSK